MMTTYEPRVVTSIGTAETATFKINANAKAFKVLIDGLYSDKVRAVIRELWTNAFDSHVDAGKGETPFECRLPSVFDPSFSVRDYGTSMSHETIMGLYSTVFESTKEGTNEQVGKLGLGSKSPFAYTDTFTVTAWMNSERRVYSAYLGSDHVPRIDLLDRSPDDAPTGLEVSFPVDADDVYEFYRKAGEVSRGFDIKPLVTSDSESIVTGYEDAAELEIIQKGANWRVFKLPNVYSTGRAYAKQGCVLYPIEPSYIKNVDQATATLLSANIIIDFPIGSVDIAASREGLSYDDTTVENIRQQISGIADEISQSYKTTFSKCATLWEATIKYNALLIDSSATRAIRELIGERLKFKGVKLENRIVIPHSRREALRGKTMCISSSQAYSGLSSRSRGPWMGKWSPDTLTSVYPGATVFYIDMIPHNAGYARSSRGVGAKIAHNFRENFDRSSGTTAVWVKLREGGSELARFLATVGRPDEDVIYMVSDLEDAPKAARTTSYRSAVSCQVWNGHAWIDDTVDTKSNNLLYISTIRRRTVDMGSTYWSVSHYNDALCFLRSVGIADAHTVLACIPASHNNKIKQAGDNWKSFPQTVKTALNNLFTPTLLAYQDERAALSSGSNICRLVKAMASHNLLPETRTPLRELVVRARIVERFLERANVSEAIISVAEKLSVKTSLSPTEVDTASEIIPDDLFIEVGNFINCAYPLLQHCLNNHGSVPEDRIKDIAHYINLVDKSKEA
jgi:hypothetical protein